MTGVDLGFMPDDTEAATTLFQSVDMDEAASLQTAMDLSRFCMVSLHDATFALVMASAGKYRPLRHLGFDFDAVMPPEDALAFMRIEVEGQAASYATTVFGCLEVAAARWANRKSTP